MVNSETLCSINAVVIGSNSTEFSGGVFFIGHGKQWVDSS